MNEQEMSFSDWLMTLLIAVVPVVGAGMLIFWAISKKGPLCRRRFSRAFLIAGVVSFFITILVLVIIVYLFGYPLLQYLMTLGSQRMY